eukprot:gb/GECH01012603.1/.p1 GENE.gb/GECH01012603.1/~~gb/GECH01012603.1/.p1  ORF type:complete len:341 (+),score=75.22 gb/GECH01012603.1/:1-1023(+)
MSLNVSAAVPSTTHLLHIGFNQNHECFAAGTVRGFSIYNCEPFKETFKRGFANGGIGIVAMLYRCNILALVGGGRYPCFPPNKVMLWDDHQSACIGELTFKSDVKEVRLRRDKIVVVLEHQVYVYNFDKLELIHRFETSPNPIGLCALSPAESSCVLACPSVTKGSVRIERLDSGSGKKFQIITAHDSTLACISLSQEGDKLATASEKGTLIRVFDTDTGEKLHEFRRGVDRAAIYSLSFSRDGQFLCSSSDKGTIHVFAISSKENRRSRMPMLGSVASYFSSEWSFSWYHGPECPSICAFGKDDSSVINVIAANGTFMSLRCDLEQGGECTCQDSTPFL